jgi:drug/metabolite transporter (DMT)-like permease
MRVALAYIGVILIWSSTPLAIKWSGEEVGFLFGVGARMALGTTFAWTLLLALRNGFPTHHRALKSYLAGGAGLYVAMTAVYWGAQQIPSGVTSVVFGTNPLFTGLLAALWLGERKLGPRHLIGLLTAFAGLAVVFGDRAELGPMAGAGIAAVLLASAVQAASGIWVMRYSGGVNALAITTGSLSVALPFYLLTWWLADGHWPPTIPDRTAGAIIYLAAVGSVIGFVLYFYALIRIGPARVSLVTLVTPVLALLLGQALNGETPLLQVWLGSALILAGLALHQWFALSQLFSGHAATAPENR